MSQTETLELCKDALNYYKNNWFNDKNPPNSNWWMKANQVTSYMQFAQVCTAAFKDPEFFYQLVRGSKSQYLGDFHDATENALNSTTDYWSDDYGWGGIACIQVAKWLKVNQPDAEPNWTKYRDQAIACLKRMMDVAKLEKVLNTTPVSGGMTNQPLGQKDGLSEFWKNTVTNALYFNLSMQLYQYLTELDDSNLPLKPIDCLKAAYDQYQYFLAWFKTPVDPPKTTKPEDTIPDHYFHPFGSAGFMIEERPVARPPYIGYDPDGTNLAWEQHCMWTGDQGLFIHASAMLYNHANDLDTVLGLPRHYIQSVYEETSTWMRNIPAGIHAGLTYPNHDKVLREAPFDMLFESLPIAYVCGRGVLVRSFTHPDTIAATNKVSPGLLHPFKTCYEATTVAIKETRKGSQIMANWTTLEADKSAYQVFIDTWGSGVKGSHWDEDPNAGFINFCMMMGFDVYAAHIKASGWA